MASGAADDDKRPPLRLGVLTCHVERCGSTAETLQYVDGVLKTELGRLGLSDSLDFLLLPETLANGYCYIPETSWSRAESLQSVALSPTLTALQSWARQYRCFIGCSVLEADVDGHFYNSFVLARPDGHFVTRRGIQAGQHDIASASYSKQVRENTNSSRSLHLVRKAYAPALESFIFTTGESGRGSDLADHLVSIDISLLLEKHGYCSVGGSSTTHSSSLSSSKCPAFSPTNSSNKEGDTPSCPSAEANACKPAAAAAAATARKPLPPAAAADGGHRAETAAGTAATTAATATSAATAAAAAADGVHSAEATAATVAAAAGCTLNIGISICAETLRYDVMSHLAASKHSPQPVQLLLAPFSAPVPCTQGKLWTMSKEAHDLYM